MTDNWLPRLNPRLFRTFAATNSKPRSTRPQKGSYGWCGTSSDPSHRRLPFLFIQNHTCAYNSLPTQCHSLQCRPPPPFFYTYPCQAADISNSGLEFTCVALSQNLENSSEELADSFRAAYGRTLKAHHSFLVKPIFSAAMSACPYRKVFYAKLGSDQDKVQAELREYLAALEKIVAILKQFLESKEAKW